MKRKQLGDYGEKLAALLLKKNGYKILDKNVYVSRLGEIDIIATHQQMLVFVEVKTRTNFNKGYPEQAITWTKYRHLYKAICGYLQKNGQNDSPWRIDVVSLVLDTTSLKPIYSRIIKNISFDW